MRQDRYAAGLVAMTSQRIRNDGEREVEWQFDAADLSAVRAWCLSPSLPSPLRAATPVQRKIGDIYLDSDDWRVHRGGYALRLRRSEGRITATLKSFGEVSGALRKRVEISERVTTAEPEMLLGAPGPVGDRLRTLGVRSLRPLFELRMLRQVLPVEANDAVAGEIALDTAAVLVEGRRTSRHLQRVEVEVTEGHEESLGLLVDALQEDCAIRPAAQSKYEFGLELAGLRPPVGWELAPRQGLPEGSVGEVAFAVLHEQWRCLLEEEPGARLGDEIETLHRMRVAVRRLRAALRLFQRCLPGDSTALRRELRWLGAELGAVRDTDVQLEQLEAWQEAAEADERVAFESLRPLLETDRRDARARMLHALNSERYARLVVGMTDLVREGPTRAPVAALMPARETLPGLLRPYLRAVRKQGDAITADSPAGEYHALRIRGKRLRYALECVSDEYGRVAKRLARALRCLQEGLGAHQDAAVAIKRLRMIAEKEGVRLPPQTVLAMGEVLERYRVQMLELRVAFPPAYARVRGKRWRALRTALRKS